MTTTEIYLLAMAIIFTVPYLIWHAAYHSQAPSRQQADDHD